MNVRFLYCRLLQLYPNEFQKQFSEEMRCVFEQRAGEHSANGNSIPLPFLLWEFFSVVKGACFMWLKNFRSKSQGSLSPFGEGSPVGLAPSREEAARQRASAIEKMVAAIARHDFGTARKFSDEEVRLQRFLTQTESNALAIAREIA